MNPPTTPAAMDLTPKQARSLAALSLYTDSDTMHLDNQLILTVTLVEGVYVIAVNGDTFSMHDEELIPLGNLGHERLGRLL